jgi:glutamine amidotransferase
MCRMFGMVADRPIPSRDLLHDAPRSLRALSREHPDGWGIAVHDGAWTVERGTRCAHACERFAAVGDRAARIVIAHVRKRTVGPVSLVNTHPFRHGDLVFAHNGTLGDAHALAARTAPEHLAEIEGDTDSERLFALVRTQIAAAGDISRGVAAAVRALHALPAPGSANFLLSCGERLYAHRLGRSLFMLERSGATLVASEPLTDEPWREVPEGALVELAPAGAHLNNPREAERRDRAALRIGAHAWKRSSAATGGNGAARTSRTP